MFRKALISYPGKEGDENGQKHVLCTNTGLQFVGQVLHDIWTIIEQTSNRSLFLLSFEGQWPTFSSACNQIPQALHRSQMKGVCRVAGNYICKLLNWNRESNKPLKKRCPPCPLSSPRESQCRRTQRALIGHDLREHYCIMRLHWGVTSELHNPTLVQA